MNNNDLLTEICSTLKLSSQLYFEAEFFGDIAVELQPEQRRIRFHLVRQGSCWVRLPGGQAQQLSIGDIAMIPNGAGQILSTSPEAQAVPLEKLLAGGALKDGVLTQGSGSNCTRLLCGFCQLDDALDHPLLSDLPSLLVIRQRDLGSEPWAEAALRLVSLESNLAGQGSSGIMTRLLEILFIQTVRRLALNAPDEDLDSFEKTSFLAALADPRLSRALMAIHGQPEKVWRLGDLAKEAGMSRARFADRFTRLVGKPPIGYLTDWRLIKARTLLAQSNLDMAEIAARCGYASVPSFSSRFKRTFEMGPGAYRRQARA